MKIFRNSELFKRVVPLTLAAIVLAGTLLGIFGTIFAYADGLEADSKKNMEIVRVQFFDKDDNLIEKSEVEPNKTYKIRVRLKPTGKFSKYDKNSIDPIETIFLFEDHFVTQSGDDTTMFKPAEGDYIEEDNKGQVYYLYELENVRIKKWSARTAKLELLVDYQDHTLPTDEISIGVILQTVDTSNEGSDWADDNDGVRGTSTESEAEVLTTPKMIITGFDIPPVVNPGEEFQVTIEFMNNSKKKDMENISMTLTPSDGVSIRNGVNKRHYIKIPRRQSTSETFTLKSSKELKAESLSLTVKFEYQYEVDNAYKDGSSEEILSISSIPKEEEEKEDPNSTEGSISSFEILSVVPPDSLYPNEDGYVTVKVINKDHQFDASNVQLTIVGDGLINSGNTEYHGALTHSTQAEIEMALQFSEAGTFPLQAIVTYEDSVGKDADGKPKVRINDIVKDFTVTVQESPDMGMDMGMGMGDMMGIGGEMFDENGMPVGGEAEPAPWYKSPVILGCGGGGVLVIVLVAILVIRKVRKKKAGDDDEDI
ncbi:MAG: hypothetical protein HFG26_13350 [Provencibacterium sp.]|jgi:hypothetical protein|nr:hypothetical protein [Provencibacterium sp.]